ncbi:MAG: NUDIX domain-containing protein [Bacteroidales bacterium]
MDSKSQQAMPRFNIRVYGIYINQARGILVTDEFRLGMYMTKFPGGGLEWGEGTLDCLRREIREELGQYPLIGEHFYTTDFFQPSWFVQPPAQLISIYYFIDLPHPELIQVASKPFAFETVEGAQSFRYLPLTASEEVFTLPVDRVVWRLLKQKFSAD